MPASAVEDRQGDGTGADAFAVPARCLFMAPMLTAGMTNAAPVPRGQSSPSSDGASRAFDALRSDGAEQVALRRPCLRDRLGSDCSANRLRLPEPLAGFAKVNRRPRLIRGSVPRLAQMRVSAAWLSNAGGMRQRFQRAKRLRRYGEWRVHLGTRFRPACRQALAGLPRASFAAVSSRSPAKFF